MKNSVLLAAIAALLALPAMAQDRDRGFYVSAKLGSTDVEADLGDTFDQVVDGDEDSTTFEAGFKFSRFWAVQAGYHDFGNIESDAFGCEVCGDGNSLRFDADTKAYSLSVVPQLDLVWRVSIFGKIGLVIWETEVDIVADDVSEFVDDFTEEDILYGLGARFRLLGNLSVFAEWESIAGDIETISLGATLQF